MTVKEQRLPLVNYEECNDEKKAMLDRWRTPDGRLFNIFRTFIVYPELLEKWSSFGYHVMRASTVPERHRELVIMRVAWLKDAEYEWSHHYDISLAIGLTEEELKRVTVGPETDGWTPFEATLLRSVKEIMYESSISKETYELLAAEYSSKQMIDLVYTVGAYSMVSTALNTFGVPLEEGMKGFDAL